jgi:hypothetical protein
MRSVVVVRGRSQSYERLGLVCGASPALTAIFRTLNYLTPNLEQETF